MLIQPWALRVNSLRDRKRKTEEEREREREREREGGREGIQPATGMRNYHAVRGALLRRLLPPRWIPSGFQNPASVAEDADIES